MRWILLFVTSLFLGLSAAESLSVTFTTTRPASAPGVQNWQPTHVVAVWVETSSGTFVKTIGDWSNRRRTSLTQWRAKAGTSDTDAVMGATLYWHESRTVTWDMSARATPGTPVANGVYKIWLETVEVNTPPAGTTSITGANRFSFSFTKDGVAKPATTVTDASGKYTNISYTYTGVTAGPTYSVVYSGNGNTGGAVPTDATSYSAGQTVTVKANSGNLVRTGYVFGGWNTLANGTGTNYTAGSGTFAMGSANVTLYAKWTPSFTVTYQGNGNTSGSVPTDATAYTTGQTVTVKTNSGTLAKTGSTFAGWNTAADGSGTSYTAGTGTFAMGTANVILYARWTVVSTASVIYDGNGNTSGSVPVDSATYSAGQTVTVKANTGTLAKTGFSFAGWNTAANGTGTDYASTGSATLVMGSADLRLYAKWTALPTFNVTYQGNGSTGGTAPTDATTYNTGQTVTVLANSGALVKTGSVFGGWNTLADGTGANYVAGSGTLVMGNANVTLYAKWTPTFTVTYQGNGSTSGSIPTDTTAYVTGQTVTVQTNSGILAKTGSTFAGWNTAANGSGTSYTAGTGTFAMGAANIILYARWIVVGTAIVTYDGNGSTSGSVPIDSASYPAGQTVTVKANTGVLAKSGFTFVGWNTAANGTGTDYASTGSATLVMGSGDLRLYAKWTALPTFTVTYQGNGSTGGTAPTDATTYNAGQTVTVLANSGTLVRTGYVFGGWNTLANGAGTNYTAGSGTFAMGSAHVTLYAKWIPSFTVTYQGNGNTSGSVPTDATAYVTGQTVTVKTNSGTLTKTGLTFAGWNTAVDGSGTSYAEGTGTFTMGAANITLYARWTVVSTASVIYDGNGSTSGSVPVDSATYSAGQTVTVKANTGALAKTGFSFAGWNTAASGTGTDYASTGSATLAMGSADLRLYAKWTALPTYTVTYQDNGSTGGTAPTDATTYITGETVTVLANSGTLVRTGYVFDGWNTLTDGTGTTYAPGVGNFTMGGANSTLYAKWTPVFFVSYDGNGNTGGSVPTDAMAYTTEENVTVLTNSGSLVKPGYVFESWNTLANGTGTRYAAGSGTFAMGSANVTLYATWAPTFTVRYDGNGNTEGSVPADLTAYIAGQNVNVQAHDGALRKDGSLFTGWNTAADGTGTSYDASGNASFVMGAADVTLYASWVVIPKFTVTYDGNGNTGGSVPVDPTAYETNQVVTVLANSGALVKAGSFFAGWNTAVDGSGSNYAPEAGSFDIQSDTVLYAHWLVPQVTELSPAGGSTDGGTLVTFRGVNLEGTTAVDFGGDAASGIVATATSVTCYAPERPPGVVAVTLTTPAGVVTGGSYLYELPGPSISSMTPVEGSTVGGTKVSIRGSNLAGTTSVIFDGIAATEVVVVSEDLVTCSTPSHAAGIVDVVLTSPTGSATITGGYTYSAPVSPAFISFLPNVASGFYAPSHILAVWVETPDGTFVRTVGNWSGERRYNLSQWAEKSGIDTDAVMGATRSTMTVVRNLTWDLRDRQGHVVSDGTYVLWIELVDEDVPDPGLVSVPGARRTHLTFTVASQAVVAVGPVDQDGFTDLQMGSAAAPIPAPVLSAISPSQGTITGGTRIVLTGAHLSGTTMVKVGGVPATALNIESDTRVTCFTPMGAVGPAVVEIITDGGADSRAGSFAYVAGGGSAYISFIPSTAGGEYAPNQVLAVWIESSSGAFVRTVGTWSATRRSDLTQWLARSGGDADAVMGATRAVAAPVNNLAWDMRDRSGALVPDGTYRLWIEVVDDNKPAAGTASVIGARRTSLAFTVSSHAVATVGPVDQDGFTNLSMGSQAGSVLGNVIASQVAEDQQTARCGGGSVYALILGGALLAVRRRRSGRG